MDYEMSWRRSEDAIRTLIRENKELQLRIDWLEETIIMFLEKSKKDITDMINDIKI